jgi:hypothetical protein
VDAILRPPDAFGDSCRGRRATDLQRLQDLECRRRRERAKPFRAIERSDVATFTG